jgi:hypothetical protein
LPLRSLPNSLPSSRTLNPIAPPTNLLGRKNTIMPLPSSGLPTTASTFAGTVDASADATAGAACATGVAAGFASGWAAAGAATAASVAWAGAAAASCARLEAEQPSASATAQAMTACFMVLSSGIGDSGGSGGVAGRNR